MSAENLPVNSYFLKEKKNFIKMEFPDLGKHCNEPTCKKLDFLPVKCDACGNIYW